MKENQKEKVVLQPIFELISGLAGLAFVVSGAYNYLLFNRLFSLNYFVIAGPNDVIMSAFLVLILFSILAVAYLILFAIAWFVRKRTELISQQAVSAVPAILILILAVIAIARASMGEQTVTRWFNERFYLVDYRAPGLAESDCREPRVRWLGEDSLVYRCENGSYRVLKGLESVKLVLNR